MKVFAHMSSAFKYYTEIRNVFIVSIIGNRIFRNYNLDFFLC